MMKVDQTGSFTMPGEAGYEDLTLSLAKRWGADVIRDCEGTNLSPKLLDAGFKVYSTICIIRDHNDFALAHPEFQQQTFLKSKTTIAKGNDPLCISLLEGYSHQQFEVNEKKESLCLWQVFDRTTNKEVSTNNWYYNPETKSVSIISPIPWHGYSVNFLAWRIWEEINMYNHITNNWTNQPLRQLDPRYPEVRTFLKDWLVSWCKDHPATDVVRFTSLFYNFVWIWGDNQLRRDIFSDWGSYDFTVSPLALKLFEKEYGYKLTSEDFINQGRRNANHVQHSKRMRDYMDFTNCFVTSFAKELIDIVHDNGKKAYVFYDDSWVGMEPYGKRFGSIGFDGIIKCVFSGFEVRLCAGVPTATHEIRLHPYLFPTGLGGLPSFSEGGNPAADASQYWVHVRRALLRQPVDRIGLGGYLHLTEKYPDFIDGIESIAKEFRTIKALHATGHPLCLKTRIAILSEWGSLRSWTCGGHYHEHPDLDLINLLESLSGLPYNVSFLSFDELNEEKLKDIDIIINAGQAKSAWTGGDVWQSDSLVALLRQWVYEGGTFLGVNEPSETEGFERLFRMAEVLGVDHDDGRRLCEGKWPVTEVKNVPDDIANGTIHPKDALFILDETTKVLKEEKGLPLLTEHIFGKGKGIYIANYRYSPENTRMLFTLINRETRQKEYVSDFITDNPLVSVTVFPEANKVILANDSENDQKAKYKGIEYCLTPFEMKEL